MKFLNDFKNLFAIVGVVSIIFWTCSAESTSDNSSDNSSNTNNPPAMTGGTYQVEHVDDNGAQIVVLNTETGVMKTYEKIAGQWGENNNGYFAPITFTH